MMQGETGGIVGTYSNGIKMTLKVRITPMETNERLNEIVINTLSCPIKNNGNTIELAVHTSCYCILDLLCVKIKGHQSFDSVSLL